MEHPTTTTSRSDSYGPVQACTRLYLARYQLDRAITAGLIPARPASGRWPAAVIEEAATRVKEIVAAVGTVPDLGAFLAANELESALGVPVFVDTIAELSRTGHLPIVGSYKGHPVYCGRTLQTLAEAGDTARALLATAEADGALHTTDQAAARLDIRRVDLDYLTAAGLLEPAHWGRSHWTPRHHAPDVPLYRAADIDALASHPDIDWPAVRATPPGRPSPLRHLTTRA